MDYRISALKEWGKLHTKSKSERSIDADRAAIVNYRQKWGKVLEIYRSLTSDRRSASQLLERTDGLTKHSVIASKMNKENQEKITLTGGAMSRILKSRLVPQPLNVPKYATSNCRVSIKIVLCIIIIPDSYTYMCVNTRSYTYFLSHSSIVFLYLCIVFDVALVCLSVADCGLALSYCSNLKLRLPSFCLEQIHISCVIAIVFRFKTHTYLIFII